MNNIENFYFLRIDFINTHFCAFRRSLASRAIGPLHLVDLRLNVGIFLKVELQEAQTAASTKELDVGDVLALAKWTVLISLMPGFDALQVVRMSTLCNGISSVVQANSAVLLFII